MERFVEIGMEVRGWNWVMKMNVIVVTSLQRRWWGTGLQWNSGFLGGIFEERRKKNDVTGREEGKWAEGTSITHMLYNNNAYIICIISYKILYVRDHIIKWNFNYDLVITHITCSLSSLIITRTICMLWPNQFFFFFEKAILVVFSKNLAKWGKKPYSDVMFI